MTMSKAATLVSFCADLKARLPTSRDSAALDALGADLATHIRAAEAQSQKAHPGAKKRAPDLDRGGTELWNLCTRLRRDLGGPGEELHGAARSREKLLARCRYFAFLLIDVARRSVGELCGRDVVHLARLALKVGKSCVGCGELAVSLGALQRAAELIEGIKGKDVDGDVEGEVMKLEVEHFILRTVQV